MILSAGTMLQDRYEILEKIGSGGMSEVYQARCHTLNRLVLSASLKWKPRRRPDCPIPIS